MATGEEIGKDYPTLMPALTDDADIQEAFTMYHYGLTSYTGIETIPEDSIEGHLTAANDRITALEGRPVAGGIVSDTEPIEVGTPPQAVPEGYIWVDGDAISSFDSDWPSVIYSPTDPSASLTLQDFGTIWVDQDGSASGSPSYKPAYIWNGTTWDLLGNQPTVDLFNDYALLSPAASANQTIINTELTSPTITSASAVGGSITNSNINYPILISPEERVSISATAATGLVNFDFLTQGILYYTSNATGNFVLNIRGNSTTTLNSILQIGDSITGSFLNTNGSTAYYPLTFQIDGVSVTPKWSGGSAPTSGNANSVDAYSYTIIKTADATFTVLAGAVQFA